MGTSMEEVNQTGMSCSITSQYIEIMAILPICLLMKFILNICQIRRKSNESKNICKSSDNFVRCE